MSTQYPGIDQSILDQIKALSGSQGLTEDEKRQQRAQAAFAAAAGLLSNMYKPTGIGLGAGIEGGLLGYNAAGQSIRRDKLAGAENMQKGIQTYGALKSLSDAAMEAKIAQEAYGKTGMPGAGAPSSPISPALSAAPPSLPTSMPMGTLSPKEMAWAQQQAGGQPALMSTGYNPNGSLATAPLPQLGQTVPQVAPSTPIPDVNSEREARANQIRAIGYGLIQQGRGDLAQKYFDQADKIMPAFKEDKVYTDANGKRVVVRIFADGTQKILQGVSPDKEKAHFADTGNAVVPVDPFTGNPQGASLPKSQSPDSAASNAVTIRGQDLTDARTRELQNVGQVVETNNGMVRVGRDNSVTPIVDNSGTQLQPKAPASIQQQVASNNVTLAKIDKALTLVDKVPGAFGLQNLAGDQVMQRVDPAGVTARAMIADVAGQKIHDRSGAAVTVGEAARLKPYIPNITDDAPTVKKKLILFRNEYKMMQSELSGGKSIADVSGASSGRTVVRTGTFNGRKVVQYSDGTTEYSQ